MKNILSTIITAVVLVAGNSAYAGDPNAALSALKAKLAKLGEPKIEGTDKAADKTVPALFFGKRKLNNNTDVVDDVKKSFGGTATIFVKNGADFTRITTNVLKDDGTRAVGTDLARNKAYEAVTKGETFCGEVEILKSMYDTCYEPIKVGSEVLGIYYVGFKK